MFPACFLAFAIGFISLSQEILWTRLFGFTNHNLPQSFSLVLMYFLIGIAIGAYIGKWFCQFSSRLWIISGAVLLCASGLDITSPWIYAAFSQSNSQITIGTSLILLTSLTKAILFPIAHHIGTALKDQNMGFTISKVYVANIVGSTLGPILTGLILLNYFTTQECYAISAALTGLLGLYCFMKYINPIILSCGILAIILFLECYAFIKPNLLISKVSDKVGKIKRIIETRQGIITIYSEPSGGDRIYGGNVYDGRTNLDPVINSNGIDRILVLSALHNNPKRVLVIGLSIGTWLKLITTFPGIENIDVVEINPGYLEAIKSYPQQLSGLLDPRVHIYIDDGRRWLQSHPKNQYDLIVMNTTLHWRAYASNLLSREFLSLIKKHMNSHAVLTFNTTSSPDALKTAVSLFSNAYLYSNFVIAADFDWRNKLLQRAAFIKLSSLKLDNKPLFPHGGEHIIQQFLTRPLISLEQTELACNQTHRKVEIITDRNLITEYKYGRQL